MNERKSALETLNRIKQNNETATTPINQSVLDLVARAHEYLKHKIENPEVLDVFHEGGTVSECLDAYLTLEVVMMAFDRWSNPLADEIRDAMDPLWYNLTRAEADALNQRKLSRS